jgi:hypothetical protein
VAIACSLAGNRAEFIAMRDTGRLEDAWLQRVLQNATRSLLPSPLLRTDVPPGVQIILNQHQDRLALHLIDTRLAAPGNLAFGDEAAASDGWTITLNRQRFGAVTGIRTLAGQAVEWSTTDDEITVQLPPVGLYTVLVIEISA